MPLKKLVVLLTRLDDSLLPQNATSGRVPNPKQMSLKRAVVLVRKLDDILIENDVHNVLSLKR